MKKLFILTLMAFTAMLCNAQDALFRKYDNTKGVTTVYVSKAMFSMMPKIKAGDINISKLAEKMDKLQALSCDRSSLASSILNEATAYYDREGFEQVMKVNDGGENTTIYMKARQQGRNEFALLVSESGELEIINILGKITLKDIRNLTGR